MLAYELFLKNKESTGRLVKSLKPIKKVFVTKKSIKIDQNTPEHYGSAENQAFSTLQSFLSMPLNNADEKMMNLPYFVTGANQANPYLEIFGSFEITKAKEPKITISLGKEKTGIFKASFNIKSGEITIDATKKIPIRLEKNFYMVGDKTLYQCYKESRLLDDNDFMSAEKFSVLANKFLDFVKSRKNVLESGKAIRRQNFSLYILPTEDTILYKKENKKTNTKSFTDSCGTVDESYGDKPTINAKFCSYDDKAFTINCHQGEQFYRDVGISSKSLSKINIPGGDVINHGGLSWLFSDMNHPDSRFEKLPIGIYGQLNKNYQKLEQTSGNLGENAQMKIVCYKKTNAKIEILIDENMTMKRMKNVFGRKDGDVPIGAFEILIDSTNRTTLWAYYLNAVRSLITGNYLDKHALLSYLNNRLRKKIHDWIKIYSDEASNFFFKSWFCMKTLSSNMNSNTGMNSAEKYAYQIGKIAGTYVDFKKNTEANNNSLRDILAYSKYDRERLRFVLKTVGQGLNLSKAKKDSLDKVNDEVKGLVPGEEIPDNYAFEDYSYFFYKGVFENKGVK